MTKIDFSTFAIFFSSSQLIAKIIPVDSCFLSVFVFLRNLLFHLNGFQFLVKDLENRLALLQIFDATMCKWAFQFEAPQAKLTGARFLRWRKIAHQSHVFWEFVKNFNKKLSLR